MQRGEYLQLVPNQQVQRVPFLPFAMRRGGTHLLVVPFILLSTQLGGTHLLVVLFIHFSFQRSEKE